MRPKQQGHDPHGYTHRCRGQNSRGNARRTTEPLPQPPVFAPEHRSTCTDSEHLPNRWATQESQKQAHTPRAKMSSQPCRHCVCQEHAEPAAHLNEREPARVLLTPCFPDSDWSANSPHSSSRLQRRSALRCFQPFHRSMKHAELVVVLCV